MPDTDHLTALLVPPNGLAPLRATQGRFHDANCPAVAAAVQQFLLNGGTAPRAQQVMSGFGCADSGTATSASINHIVDLCRRGSHGFNVVVHADNRTRTSPATRFHSFNVVNISGNVYYLDAFNSPPCISAANAVAQWVTWATHFEYDLRFVCRVVSVR